LLVKTLTKAGMDLGFLRIIRRFRIVGQETNNNKGLSAS